MQINHHGKNSKVHLPQDHKPKSLQAGEVKSGSGVDQTEQVKPQRLVDRFHGDAKVRERLLVEIEAKIQAGEYFTRSAAVEAAQEITDL
jgi:hypothetical protein